ncbi:alpha/beta fold hydrolase [uncultured Jannaschia sp.]|uniref:alpha/beta fold hydrolase n=1 Tax=uncultured Jannaschia sp. TaxID=293347 RepID=UPI00262B130D|nr:alpha/beta hydrolase [uncultured Jannaschia sp.]
MILPAAPYHAEVAAGPPGARPVWVDAADGVRLRAVTWPEGPRGTVMLFQGRTEYVEKYSYAARELRVRGYATAAIDWRGQGLSPRSSRDPRLGHVRNFGEFQDDVDALLTHCATLDIPRPWHLLAHSMGGLIGLRALHRRSEFTRAVFSAPMWGLPLAPHRRLVGWVASSLASGLGFGERLAPGAAKVADPAAAPFEGNLLTTDSEMFAWMKRQITVHPELALGGPSFGWIWAALREMHRLAREPAPDTPCLTFLGTDEDIVSPDAIHVRMGSWSNGTLEMVEGARHEVLMEGPETRRRLYDRIAAHLG